MNLRALRARKFMQLRQAYLKSMNGIARIVSIQPHSSLHHMDAFAPTPPDWIESAVHAWEFCCPACKAASTEAQQVWINRRSPVFTDRQGRKWQEFYHCHCGTAWWAWSSDRPPSEFTADVTPPEPTDLFWRLDDSFPDVFGSE